MQKLMLVQLTLSSTPPPGAGGSLATAVFTQPVAVPVGLTLAVASPVELLP